jgi:hypothetical protein
MNPCNVQEIYKYLQIRLGGHTYKHRPRYINPGTVFDLSLRIFVNHIMSPDLLSACEWNYVTLYTKGSASIINSKPGRKNYLTVPAPYGHQP